MSTDTSQQPDDPRAHATEPVEGGAVDAPDDTDARDHPTDPAEGRELPEG